MWKQIADNKRKTTYVLLISFILMMIIGCIFGFILTICGIVYIPESTEGASDWLILLPGTLVGCGIALVVWVIELFVAFINGNHTVLKIFSAFKLPTGSHNVLQNVVEEMSIAAGLPKVPQVYVIDSNMPNAFASGLKPEKSVIVVTTGLLSKLNRDELQGVIAHEISHIKNRDTSLLLYACVMFGTILFLSELGLRIFFRSSGGRRSSSRGNGGAILILIALALTIISFIVTPLLIRVLYSFLSKKREYLADACAAQLTRYPAGLASALCKISSSEYTVEDSNSYTNAMFIVNPKETANRTKKKLYQSFQQTDFLSPTNVASFLSSGCETHPPTEQRINILLKMTGADLKSYDDALKEVSKRKTKVLRKEDLEKSEPLSIREPSKDFIQTSALPMLGITAVSAAAATPTTVTKTTVTEEQKEIIAENIEKNKDFYKTQKREAENLVWKASGYIFKECDCGTKLKFPNSYKGQTIACPHCKKPIVVEE